MCIRDSPISQDRVKYHRALNFFVLFTMLFNGGMVPWFIVCRNMLHLKDSVWALILPYLANAWYIFLTRNYYRSIPAELVESAKIDGASEYRIFFQIILPLAKPVIATISLFISLNYWNDWWLGIMLIDNTDLQPLQPVSYTHLDVYKRQVVFQASDKADSEYDGTDVGD